MRNPLTCPQTASLLSVSLFGLEVVTQLGIAVGIFPVTIVWGGSQSELTLSLRLASIAAAGILLGFAWIVHQKAASTGSGVPAPVWIRWACWFVTAYMILNTIGNFMSTSWFERYVSGTVTILLSVCCWRVASAATTTPVGTLAPNGGYESL